MGKNYSAHYDLSLEEAEDMDFTNWEPMGAVNRNRKQDGNYRNKNGTKGKSQNITSGNKSSVGLDNFL
jgi:hypothetical protein